MKNPILFVPCTKCKGTSADHYHRPCCFPGNECLSKHHKYEPDKTSIEFAALKLYTTLTEIECDGEGGSCPKCGCNEIREDGTDHYPYCIIGNALEIARKAGIDEISL